MGNIMISLLVALIVLSFLPAGQRFLEKVSFGLLRCGAIPWIGIGAVFIWTYKVFPSPGARGAVLGLVVTAIAATLSWWAPRNPNVKGIIQNMFFGGKDIWSLDNYKMYLGMIWGAGLVLLIPMRGLDTALNIGGLLVAIVWIVWQSYNGHKENAAGQTPGSENTTVPNANQA